MNTVLKGDKFEDIGIELIHKLIEEEQILINANYIRTFKKHKYKCKSREGFVEFDYVIEVWPPNAERFSIAYFIECKDYKNRVGVNQIKKFHNDIEEVSGANAKGIFISKSLLQEGAKTYAEANGFMVIQANNVENYKIIYHKGSLKKVDISTLFGEISDPGILGLTKIIDKHIHKAFEEFTSEVSYNLENLSKENIEKICEEELNKINPKILTNAESLDIELLKSYLLKTYNITISYHENNDLLGFYDIEENSISLNIILKNTKRELFVLCHEFGHFKLHQNLIIDQLTYNTFKESEYNFKIGKHSLTNPKHWIEWQANYFSANLILPKVSLLANLYKNQNRLNIRKGTLYLDDQNENYKNYQTILFRLSEYFNVTRPNILYQLKEINQFENRSNLKSAREIIEGMNIGSHI